MASRAGAGNRPIRWNGLPCLVFATDGDLVIRALDGVEAPARADLLGRPVAELLAGLEHADWEREAVQRALQGATAGRESRLGGVPVMVRLGPRRDARGRVTGIMGLLAARALNPDERPWRFLQAVLGHSRATVAVLDVNGVFSYWSPAVQQALGRDPGDLLGRSLLHLVHPDDHESVRHRLARAMEGERPQVALMRMQHGNGSWRQMELHLASLAHDPEVNGVVASFRDVTDSNAAWRELEKSELFYRTLLTTAFDAIEVLGPRGERKFVSPAIRNLLGYSEAEWLQFRPFAVVHPDDRAALSRIYTALVAEPGARTEMDLRLRHKNGDWRLVHAVATNLVEDPVIAGVATNWRDVTNERAEVERRRRAEETYRVLASSTPYAIYQLDSEGRVVSANDAAARVLSREPQGAVGYALPDLAAESHRPRVREMLDAALRGVASEFEFETGAGLHVRTSLVPVTDGAGRVDRVAGLGQDVTAVRREVAERETLEAQLRQAQKLESIGQLAGGIAHDFNNLLMVILAHASFLERAVKDEGPRQDIASILSAAQRAGTLTRQLLTVSRQQPVAATPMDVSDRLGSMGDMLRRLLPENVELVVRADDELPQVEADGPQFDQVLLNLVLNARDAMPDGGRMEVTATAADFPAARTRAFPGSRAGRHVVLAVKDTGTGMSEDVLRRIFEPFFTTKPPGRGTGLGLAVVYGIMQRHGGSVECESSPGNGTTFRTWWPALEERTGVLPGAAPGAVLGGTETVLVAEDDPSVRDVVMRVLGRAGYQLLSAENGEEAVEKALGRDVDLVILDAIMPRLSGPEAWRRIKARKPGTRFLFCSGYSSELTDQDTWRREGITFLAKPYEPETLLHTVRSILDRPSTPT